MRRLHPIFGGSITALPTPFRGDGPGRIDHGALLKLAERQIAGGTDGLVIGGSTGEATSLTADERRGLFEFTAGVVRDRVPVIAGVGASDTRTACELAVAAQLAGVHGLLVATPAYSRPTQEGLVQHFSAVARVTDLPIALYNIPGRTAVDLLPETAARVAGAHDNVVAIKESSDSLERLRALLDETELVVLCGEDRWIADALELGCGGTIAVVSNLAPAQVARLVHLFDQPTGHDEAPAILEQLSPLIRALSVESNPAPLKAALELLGLASGHLRLPLVPISEPSREKVLAALRGCGLA